MLFTFPLYQFYQYRYKYKFETLGYGPGYGQDIFASHAGFHFKSVYRRGDHGTEITGGYGSFLIIHKKIGEELQWAYQHFGRDNMASKQIKTMGHLFRPPVLRHMFGNNGMITPSGQHCPNGSIAYEDQWIQVVRLE